MRELVLKYLDANAHIYDGMIFFEDLKVSELHYHDPNLIKSHIKMVFGLTDKDIKRYLKMWTYIKNPHFDFINFWYSTPTFFWVVIKNPSINKASFVSVISQDIDSSTGIIRYICGMDPSYERPDIA